MGQLLAKALETVWHTDFPASPRRGRDRDSDRAASDLRPAARRPLLTAYAKAHAAGPWFGDLAKPVSVNVSVRSLLSDLHVATVQETIIASRLDAADVTLEISEKDAIEGRRGERWPGEPHAYFHQRLVALAGEIGVSLAIDDFGAGYASVSRVAELPLTQIKVDRAILYHPQAIAELTSVVKVARDSVEQGMTNIGRIVDTDAIAVAIAGASAHDLGNWPSRTQGADGAADVGATGTPRPPRVRTASR